MSAQGTYRFYSVQRQTILLVNGEPLGRERVKLKYTCVSGNLAYAIKCYECHEIYFGDTSRRLVTDLGNICFPQGFPSSCWTPF